jgi:DNA invertase Pin-like site-specific DNA recombinase
MDNNFDFELFGRMLGQIDWAEYSGLARIVQSDISKAFAHVHPEWYPGRPSQLNTEQKVKVCQRYKDGESVNKLAEDYNVHRQTIYRTLGEVFGRRAWHRRKSASPS